MWKTGLGPAKAETSELHGELHEVCTAAALGSTLLRTRRVDASIVRSLEQPSPFGPRSEARGEKMETNHTANILLDRNEQTPRLLFANEGIGFWFDYYYFRMKSGILLNLSNCMQYSDARSVGWILGIFLFCIAQILGHRMIWIWLRGSVVSDQ